MSAILSQNATAPAAPFAVFARLLRAVRRKSLFDYANLLGGASTRLALQMVYFVVLANTLSLSEMGTFASVSAAGMMIGCFGALGFQAFLFRSAAGRPAALGRYFAAYYFAFAGVFPVSLAFAWAIYEPIFSSSIGLGGYLTIVVVEIGLWRFLEMLVLVNNGLGRYGSAATVLAGATAFRTLAALAFLASGGGDAARWSLFYLAGNAVAALVFGFWHHPRVKLRFSGKLFALRWQGGVFYTLSYFAFYAQNELDKIVILWLAGARMAGVYAIAMRLLDLTAAPFRPIYVIYTRKLVQAGKQVAGFAKEIVRIEALIAASSLLLFAGLAAVLLLWPNLLGRNVATASGFLLALAATPALRNILEFHSELFFALDRQAVRSAFAIGMVLLKSASMALLIVVFVNENDWARWINMIYLGLVLISLFTVRALLTPAAKASAQAPA